MAEAGPILDLSTLIERPSIRVDGAIYHLKSAEELTLLESQQFGAWGKELDVLAKDPARADELAELVDEVATEALTDMPAEVFGKLLPLQKLSVVEVFTGLLLGRRMALAGAIVSRFGQRTGARSSRASSSSMAAIRGGGSPKRRRRS